MQNKPPTNNDNSRSPPFSPQKKRKTNGKEIDHGEGIVGVMEFIVGGFVGGGSSNNACKRHLQEVNKKVKLEKRVSGLVIYFSNNDYPKGFHRNHDDLMVITTTIHNYAVKRILINQGSSIDILYNTTTTSMNIKKSDLRPHDGNLINFILK